MIPFFRHNSRFGYHGWALQVKGSRDPIYWTVRPTRQEVRELREQERNWMRPSIEVVKIRIKVEVVE